jgi:TonB family protein
MKAIHFHCDARIDRQGIWESPVRSKTPALFVLLFIASGMIPSRVPGAEAIDSKAELARLQASAASGSIDSQLELALAYDEGKLTKRDAAAAAQWYQRAADQGSGVAELQLGAFAETGDGLPQDYQAARAHYQKAAALGVAAANLKLGLMNLEGWGGPRDAGAAVSLITQAAEAGDHSAQKVLSDMYFAGVGVKSDLHQALAWASEAAKADDPEAETRVGAILSHLHAEDARDAREWFQLSAEEDYTRGMLSMASTFLRPGASADQAELGRKWLELAAESNDGSAEFYLAGFYLVVPTYSAQPGAEDKARSLLKQSFQTGLFLAGEVLELASSNRTLAQAWTYVLSVPMEERYVQRFDEKRAEAERNPSATHIPYPIKMVRPVYPMAFRMTRTEGTVVVDFIVDTTGRVRNAFALQSTHPGFSESAVLAVSAWRFLPASRDGRIVNTHMRVPVYFRMSDIHEAIGKTPPDPTRPNPQAGGN